jgi:hypothetical protein
VNPGAVRLTPLQRNQNSAAAYAELSGLKFSMPHGQSHHLHLHQFTCTTEQTDDECCAWVL